MIQRDNSDSSSAAFTRTEVVFSVVGVVVVAALLIAWGAKVSRQNDVARCKDNLKHVGLAVLLWIDENDANSLPWNVRNAPAEGDRRRNECWFHMMSLSNHLISPKLLVCPADKRARIAKMWDTNPGSGFGAATYRDRACSYAVALDGGIISGNGPIPLDALINSVVFLDRHLGGKSTPEQCRSAQIASTGFQKPFDLWWKPELHGASEGNVTLLDGSVQTGSKSMVERALPIDLLFKNSTHVLFPKRTQTRTGL